MITSLEQAAQFERLYAKLGIESLTQFDMMAPSKSSVKEAAKLSIGEAVARVAEATISVNPKPEDALMEPPGKCQPCAWLVWRDNGGYKSKCDGVSCSPRDHSRYMCGCMKHYFAIKSPGYEEMLKKGLVNNGRLTEAGLKIAGGGTMAGTEKAKTATGFAGASWQELIKYQAENCDKIAKEALLDPHRLDPHKGDLPKPTKHKDLPEAERLMARAKAAIAERPSEDILSICKQALMPLRGQNVSIWERMLAAHLVAAEWGTHAESIGLSDLPAEATLTILSESKGGIVFSTSKCGKDTCCDWCFGKLSECHVCHIEPHGSRCTA